MVVRLERLQAEGEDAPVLPPNLALVAHRRREHAIHLVAELHIDDSASPGLLELASKAPRLKSEKQLDLIVIDHL